MGSTEPINREGVESTTSVVSLDAIADLAAAALRSVPPKPLPSGWVLKESRSNPNYYYYFNQETGMSTWQPPVDETISTTGVDNLAALDVMNPAADSLNSAADSLPSSATAHHLPDQSSQLEAAPETAPSMKSSKKRSMDAISTTAEETSKTNRQPSKKQQTPKQVRVFHILKKHKDARRPSSWRTPKITISLQEARDEISGILEILKETAEHGDPDELKATFQELAQTESDCSSAKRGGDLGYFGPKKMQPNFEQAAFALEIGQLSSIVETSSGVHVLLRVG